MEERFSSDSKVWVRMIESITAFFTRIEIKQRELYFKEKWMSKKILLTYLLKKIIIML